MQVTVEGTDPPYKPLAIPGTVQAEDYDLGGEGVAYHDTTAGNSGGAYRQDGVDIETAGGITNVGWIRNGEFLHYTATVAVPGRYTMSTRVASPNAAGPSPSPLTARGSARSRSRTPGRSRRSGRSRSTPPSRSRPART